MLLGKAFFFLVGIGGADWGQGEGIFRVVWKNFVKMSKLFLKLHQIITFAYYNLRKWSRWAAWKKVKLFLGGAQGKISPYSTNEILHSLITK